MVCRENKARSAVMGVCKEVLAQQIGHREHDSFFQSTIHAQGHTYAGAQNPSREEYMAFLQGMRQQVIDNPSIPDESKYRVSHKQPGYVTRLDQEIERVRTGKDEHGRPLRPEQINGGKHFAAMQRMQPTLARAVASREAYLETYARTTGTSVGEARQRWETLNARDIDRSALERQKPEHLQDPKKAEPRPDLRDPKKSAIRLTDDWRDSLKVAGMNSQQQADLMADNRSRQTLEIMEQERLAKIRTLPSRKALRPEHEQKVISTQQADSMVRCDTCGQFGHEESACPNVKEFNTLSSAMAKHADAKRHHEQVAEQVLRYQVAKADSEATGKPIPDDVVNPSSDELREARRAERVAASAHRKARDEFDAKRGQVPVVSDAIAGMAYNRETGALRVTHHGYTKKNGEVKPPKDYMYRMSNEEYDEMLASPSVGEYLNKTVHAKGVTGDRYKYDNEQDAAEAAVERRCPSCGRWASMNTSHQCPVVEGSRSNAEEAAYRERTRVAREKAAREGLNTTVTAGTHARLQEVVRRARAVQADGTTLDYPNPADTLAARQTGRTARGPIIAKHHDATVTGMMHSWRDPKSGQAWTTMSQMKCSCGEKETCVHRERAGNLVAAANRSLRAHNVTPGSPVVRSSENDIAADAPERGGLRRINYDRIQKMRAENVAQLQRDWTRGRNQDATETISSGREFATMPTDAESGNRYAALQPSSYSSSGGQSVDVSRPNAYAAEQMEKSLSARSNGKRWVVLDNGDGSQRITAPPERLNAAGQMTQEDSRELGAMLGLSRTRSHATGVYIPDEPAWRHEMMERTAGEEPTIRGGRFMATNERTMYRPNPA